jgi:MSHA pilin protein MshC
MLLGKKQQGFSMIEMVTVLVLLGVLGAAAFSRFGNTSSYTEAIVQQELLAYFQLTQRVAVAHQDSTTSFTLTRNGDQWDIALQFDGQTVNDQLNAEQIITVQLNSFSADLDEGVTYRAEYSDDGDLVAVTSPTNLSVTHSVQFSIGSRALCIAPTGFAYEGSCL